MKIDDVWKSDEYKKLGVVERAVYNCIAFCNMSSKEVAKLLGKLEDEIEDIYNRAYLAIHKIKVE